MAPGASWRARAVRRTLITIVWVLLIAAIVFFPFAGRWLVSEDPPQPSDALVVLAGTRAERFLEAVDLYKKERAPVILLSPGRLEAAELVLQQRGIRQVTEAEMAR